MPKATFPRTWYRCPPNDPYLIRSPDPNLARQSWKMVAGDLSYSRKRFSIPLPLLLSTPSEFRTAGAAENPQTLRDVVKTVEHYATNLDVFDAVFRLLIFGYSDTTEICTVTSEQINYWEVTGEATAEEEDLPLADQHFPTVNLDFDNLVDGIDLAEAIEAFSTADILYEEYCSVFDNVVLTTAQTQKLFASGKRMQTWLLEHIFGFDVERRPPELFGEHLDESIEAILHVPGLIEYVESKYHQYATRRWSAPIGTSIIMEIAEHGARKEKERQEQVEKELQEHIQKNSNSTSQDNKRKGRRKGGRPNKRTKADEANVVAEEEPNGEHPSVEVDEAPETPPDASRARDSGTGLELGDLDAATGTRADSGLLKSPEITLKTNHDRSTAPTAPNAASGTGLVNSNDKNAISTNKASARATSGVMTRSQRAAWAEEVARAPTPPSSDVVTATDIALPVTANGRNPSTQTTGKTTMTTIGTSETSPASGAVPAAPSSTALTQTTPAPIPTPWKLGARLRQRPGNWKDKMKH